MPTNIQVIHACEFVKATAEGALDLKETRKALFEAASLFPPCNAYHVLLDTRHAQSTMSTFDLYLLASELGSRPMPICRKIAILCPIERFEYAEFLETCSQNRGVNLNAFHSFEVAISWLCGIENTPCSGLVPVQEPTSPSGTPV